MRACCNHARRTSRPDLRRHLVGQALSRRSPSSPASRHHHRGAWAGRDVGDALRGIEDGRKFASFRICLGRDAVDESVATTPSSPPRRGDLVVRKAVCRGLEDRLHAIRRKKARKVVFELLSCLSYWVLRDCQVEPTDRCRSSPCRLSRVEQDLDEPLRGAPQRKRILATGWLGAMRKKPVAWSMRFRQRGRPRR